MLNRNTVAGGAAPERCLADVSSAPFKKPVTRLLAQRTWTHSTVSICDHTWISTGTLRFQAALPCHMIATLISPGQRRAVTKFRHLGSDPLLINQGNVFFLPAEQVYEGEANGTANYRWFGILMPPAFIDQASDGHLKSANIEFLPFELCQDPLSVAGMQGLASMFVDSPEPPSSILVDWALMGVLSRLLTLRARVRASTPVARGGLTGRARRTVVDYIEAHLAANMSLDELARLAGLSKFHFCRAFKQSFGMPPHAYVSDRRVARIKDRLSESAGHINIGDLAFEFGFSSPSHLARVFRKQAGVTPSLWQRERTGVSVSGTRITHTGRPAIDRV